MAIPTITALPTPPSRADSANFDTRADAFLAAIPTFQTETNATVAATNLATAQVTADAADTAADVVTCAGYVSDAEDQVGLAAAQVTLAAGQVTLATAQADRAEENADRAGEAVPAWNGATAYDYPQLAAATDGYTYRAVAPTTGNNPTTDDGSHWVSINGVPKFTTGDAAKIPVVNAGGTAYELSALKTINSTSLLGSGDITVESFAAGDILLSARTLSAPDWLPADGSAFLQASYPDLYAAIGLLKSYPPSKLSNPAALPTGDGYGVAFSSDDTYMAVAHNTSPYITIFDYLGYDTSTLFLVPNVEDDIETNAYIKP